MIEPVRRFFIRVCIEPRLLPGVRCSVLKTEYRSPSCWMTIPGRRSVALMLLMFGPIPCLNFGNSSGRPLTRRREGITRRADPKAVLSAKNQYKGRPATWSIGPVHLQAICRDHIMNACEKAARPFGAGHPQRLEAECACPIRHAEPDERSRSDALRTAAQ